MCFLTDLSLARKLEMPISRYGGREHGKVHNTSNLVSAAIPDSSGEGKYVFRSMRTTRFSEPRRPQDDGDVDAPWIAAIPDVYLHFPDDAQPIVLEQA